jgi:hypothetical protein
MTLSRCFGSKTLLWLYAGFKLSLDRLWLMDLSQWTVKSLFNTLWWRMQPWPPLLLMLWRRLSRFQIWRFLIHSWTSQWYQEGRSSLLTQGLRKYEFTVHGSISVIPPSFSFRTLVLTKSHEREGIHFSHRLVQKLPCKARPSAIYHRPDKSRLVVLKVESWKYPVALLRDSGTRWPSSAKWLPYMSPILKSLMVTQIITTVAHFSEMTDSPWQSKTQRFSQLPGGMGEPLVLRREIGTHFKMRRFG